MQMGVLRSRGFTEYEERVIVRSLALVRETLGLGSVGELIGVLESINFPVNDTVRRLVSESMGVRADYNQLRREQYELAVRMDDGLRKLLAFYPTNEVGVETLIKLLGEVGVPGGSVVVADPFMGSGVLLTRYVEEFEVGGVWGIEVNPVAALLAYSLLLHILNDAGKVFVRVGDAFAEVLGNNLLGLGWRYVADVVLSNPPFTRWEVLGREYREYLRGLVRASGYGGYLARSQLNLSIIGMFVVDRVLRSGGVMGVVVPASVFYTISGAGVKELLLSNYTIHAVARGSPSFSLGSGFMELIVLARKVPDDGGVREIKVINSRVGVVRLDREVMRSINWLLLFNEEDLNLLSAMRRCEEQGLLVRLGDLVGRDSVVRGVEMYGPDFFLIPNRYWRVSGESSESIVITMANGGVRLEIPRKYLVKALRKPSLYGGPIVKPTHYFLSIPPTEDLEDDVKAYINYGIKLGTAKPALKFGRYWYSHVYSQIRSKRPFGRLFLPDKVVPGRFRVFMTEEVVTATKNFYIIKTSNEAIVKMLFQWLNTDIVRRYFAATSRYISESWTRYVEDDYLKMPVPKNPESMEQVITILSRNSDTQP